MELFHSLRKLIFQLFFWRLINITCKAISYKRKIECSSSENRVTTYHNIHKNVDYLVRDEEGGVLPPLKTPTSSIPSPGPWRWGLTAMHEPKSEIMWCIYIKKVAILTKLKEKVSDWTGAILILVVKRMCYTHLVQISLNKWIYKPRIIQINLVEEKFMDSWPELRDHCIYHDPWNIYIWLHSQKNFTCQTGSEKICYDYRVWYLPGILNTDPQILYCIGEITCSEADLFSYSQETMVGSIAYQMC